MTTLQERKGNKITDEIKHRGNTRANLMKGNPELTAKSEKKINEMKKQQDLKKKGKTIKPYKFKLTDKEAPRNTILRNVRDAQKEKRRIRASTLPGPPYPPAPQIAPHLFGIIKKDRTRKRQFPPQKIVRGGRRTRRKRRNRKRKTKKKRKRRRTKKKRRRRHRKTRR